MSAFFQDKHNNKRLSVSGVPLYVCAMEGTFGGWRPHFVLMRDVP